MPASLLRMDVSGGFRRILLQYPPHYRLATHQDHRSRISLVLAGAVREWTPQSDVFGAPTSVVFKPGDAPHSNLFGPQGAVMLSVVWPTALEEIADLRRLHERLTWHERGAVNRAVLALNASAAWTTNQPAVLENLFLELLGSLEGDGPSLPAGTPPAWFLRARDHLDDTFDQPYSVRGLAAAAGVHPVHFSRAFRHYSGCTVSAYVRHRRVQAMAQDLIGTRRAAWHLALDAGFADGAHATRSFQKELGLPPSAYRKLYSAPR